MSRSLMLSAAATLALAAPAAHAAIIEFPALNSRSFIELLEIDSGLSLCNQTCSLVASPTSSVSQAPFSLVGGPQNARFVNASGDISGTAMHSIVSGNIGVEYDLGFTDTYTVHGGTGPFAITVTLAADAIASSLQSGPFQTIAGASLAVTLGMFSVDPSVVFQPSVIPFDPSTTVGRSAVINRGGIMPAFSVPLTASTSYTRIVNPGDVFDIGYELQSGFALGSIDASHTATINFTLPDGVFLTGASGATFGNAPPVTGVPEPASWAMMIAGFGLAGALLRRRRVACA